VIGAVVLLVVVVAAGAWLTLRALTARTQLVQARQDLSAARAAVLRGEVRAARAPTERAREATGRAVRATHDPVWTVASAIPVLGRTPAAVRTVTEVADELAAGAVPELVAAAEVLDPRGMVGPGGQVRLDVLRSARPAAVRALRSTDSAAADLGSVRGPLPGPVADNVRSLAEDVDELGTLTDGLARATEIGPAMLGGGGERTYLLAVQNPAEARGTGGLLGVYGLLTADGGRVRLVETGRNHDLRDARRLPVDLGREYSDLYGDDPGIWRNSNLSPHFPYAARIWLALYERQFGERLDGVLAVDPVMLGYLLRSTGPVDLPNGQRVNAGNAARLVLRDAYERLPRGNQDRARDEYLIGLGEAVTGAVLAGDGDPTRMARAVRQSVDENRLQIWSSRPDEQRRLAGTRVAGELPRTPGPFAELVVNNGGGNKLDYYTERRVTYRLRPCGDEARRSRITVDLRNDAPSAGLPDYVVGRGLRDAEGGRLPRGTNRMLVYLVTTKGSQLVSATLDGRRLGLQEHSERGHPVLFTTVDAAPGETRTVEVDLVEPARSEDPRVRVQPMVTDQRTLVRGSGCPDG
jgi:hypothetical protein